MVFCPILWPIGISDIIVSIIGHKIGQNIISRWISWFSMTPQTQCNPRSGHKLLLLLLYFKIRFISLTSHIYICKVYFMYIYKHVMSDVYFKSFMYVAHLDLTSEGPLPFFIFYKIQVDCMSKYFYKNNFLSWSISWKFVMET